MPKPKASHMPGGAPIGAKKRATKRKPPKRARTKNIESRDSSRGARAAKPRAKQPPRAKAKKAKPPCKYGPRTAQGRCPKKPKAAVATARRVTAIISPKSTRQERITSARELGHAAATGVATQAVRDIRRASRSKRGRDALKKAGIAALGAAKTIAKRGGALGAAGAAFGAGVALRSKEIDTIAEQRVRAVEKKLGALPPGVRATLKAQHKQAVKKSHALRAPSYGR
jgi:hypothetical protein